MSWGTLKNVFSWILLGSPLFSIFLHQTKGNLHTLLTNNFASHCPPVRKTLWPFSTVCTTACCSPFRSSSDSSAAGSWGHRGAAQAATAAAARNPLAACPWSARVGGGNKRKEMKVGWLQRFQREYEGIPSGNLT